MKIYEVFKVETFYGPFTHDLHYLKRRRPPIVCLTTHERLYKAAVEWGNLELCVIWHKKYDRVAELVLKQLKFQTLMYLASGVMPTTDQVKAIRNQTIGGDLQQIFQARSEIVDIWELRR